MTETVFFQFHVPKIDGEPLSILGFRLTGYDTAAVECITPRMEKLTLYILFGAIFQ